MATYVESDSSYGNVFIDALATDQRWSRGDLVSYFLSPGKGDASGSGSYPSNWQAAGGGAAFARAAAAWSAVCSVSFVRVDSAGAADIVEKTYSAPGSDTLAEHAYPNDRGSGGRFNTGLADVYTSANNKPGGISYLTFLHELGHALGLDHPFDAGATFPGVSAGDETDVGDNGLCQTMWTVMAYQDGYNVRGDAQANEYGWQLTPMAFDIAAVQAMYGANLKTATGDDIYRLPEGASGGYACIWDAGGTDTVVAGQSLIGATIDLRAATLRNEEGGGGFVSQQAFGPGGFIIAHGVVIENAIGSVGDDILIGNEAANRLDAGDGRDLLTGGGGRDTFVVGLAAGETGDRISDFRSGSDRLEVTGFSAVRALYGAADATGAFSAVFVDAAGARAAVTIEGSFRASDIKSLPVGLIKQAGDGADTLAGSSHDDELSGGAGDDSLSGGKGRDLLVGGTGHDRLEGGAGDDRYEVDSKSDVVVEAADAGHDTVVAQSSFVLPDAVEDLFYTAAGGTRETGNALGNLIAFEGPGDPWARTAAIALYGLGGADDLRGAAGDDRLDGGSGADVLAGFAGNDTYYVDDAADVVVEDSGRGVDTVRASIGYTLGDFVENLVLTGSELIDGTGNALDNAVTGNDRANILSGGEGADVLAGRGGEDLLDGGTGADRMAGGLGDDWYVVDNSADVVDESGGGGRDTVSASASTVLADGVEVLILTGSGKLAGTGNELDNEISGNAGANRLAGGGGADLIDGGAGGDRITGGAGRDVLIGGAGDDRFLFAAGDFGGRTSASADEIADFAKGDRIDLRQVDAVRGEADDAFTFIGTASFTHQAGELRYFVDGDAAFVSGDWNGDGKADFRIRLDGVSTLAASDFLL